MEGVGIQRPQAADHSAVALHEEEALRTCITCCGDVNLAGMQPSSTMGSHLTQAGWHA